MKPELSLAALHERHGVEEMQSHEPIRSCGGRGHGRDREGRRVRREDRLRAAQAIEFLPHAVLELEIFGDGLDDDVALLERAEVGLE
jgi:hypothetical protein